MEPENLNSKNGSQDEYSSLYLSKLEPQALIHQVEKFFYESPWTDNYPERLEGFLLELDKLEFSAERLLSFALPRTVQYDKNGDTSWSLTWRAILEISSRPHFKKNRQLQVLTQYIENIIEQNPQMVGAVALWRLVKDYMWRKDVPNFHKGSLTGAITYALAFFDQTPFHDALLEQINLIAPENYAELSSLVESIKWFWSAAQEGYAVDNVPQFYIKVLDAVEAKSNGNYLLTKRIERLRKILKHSNEFIEEPRDKILFKISKDIYASNTDKGIMLTTHSNQAEAKAAIDSYKSAETQTSPPQWMIDQAIANGEAYVEWTLPLNIKRQWQEKYSEMHSLATIPLTSYVPNFVHGSDVQELIRDYEYLISRPMREQVQEDFSFNLVDLTITEQFYFLNYLKQITVDQADNVKKFVSIQGINGLRAFISIGRGGLKLGDSIIKLGLNQPESAREVFEYYLNILERAEQAERLVEGSVNCEQEDCVAISEQVRKNILNRGQRDLENALKTEDVSSLIQLLKTFVISAKEYVAILQEIPEAGIEIVSSGDLKEEDVDQMRTLLTRNYTATYPEPHFDNFRELVSNSFESAIQNPDSQFRLLRDGKKIIAFNRFDRAYLDDEVITYFGSFNVSPAYSGLGSIMLTQSVLERAKDDLPIKAHSDPYQPITKKYLEIGFYAVDYYEVEGNPSFEIWRDKKTLNNLISPKMGIQELLAEAQRNNNIIVRPLRQNDDFIELKSGFVATRITGGPDNLVVYEKL